MFWNLDILPNRTDNFFFNLRQQRSSSVELSFLRFILLGAFSHRPLWALYWRLQESTFLLPHWAKALSQIWAEWLTPKFPLAIAFPFLRKCFELRLTLEKWCWKRCSGEPLFFLASWREPTGRGRREKAPTLIEVFARASCVISIFGSLQRDFPAFKEGTFAGLHRLTASF